MIITYEGADYDVDTDEIDIDEWRELKRKYGMTPKAFQDGLAEADADASTFLWYLMLRSTGKPGVTLGNHLKPNLIKLNAAMAKATAAEAEEEEARKKAELEAAAAEAAAAVPTGRPVLCHRGPAPRRIRPGPPAS